MVHRDFPSWTVLKCECLESVDEALLGSRSFGIFVLKVHPKSTIRLFQVMNLIKLLHQKLPASRPIGMDELHELGISNALAAKYVRSGWLERLDRGVYKFAGARLGEDETLRFLEGRIPDLHIASKSALGRHGYRQSIPYNELVVVWTTARARFPCWAKERFLVRFGRHELFDRDLPQDSLLVRSDDSEAGPLISQPECALLEMLSDVGVGQEVEEARGIMESVRRLRSRRMEELFASCRRVKALRLCVLWSEEFKLPWAENIREWVPEDKRLGRWVGRLKDGKVLSLPPL